MVKKLLFLIFILQLTPYFAQNNSFELYGFVSIDSISPESIHVINITSNKATLTNQYGEFNIVVKENDTLLFTSVQIENKKIIINKKHLKNLQLTIKLKVDINQLDEVVVKQHDLIGNLAIDASNYEDPIHKKTKSALDFSGIDFSMPVINELDEIDRAKPTSAEKLTNPNIPIGGDLIGLMRPLFKELSKIGENKRHERKLKRQFIIQSKKVPDKVRKELGDTFFTNTLKIPLDKIDSFILYCMQKDLAKLYIENNKIELIDLLINQSKLYLETLNNEK